MKLSKNFITILTIFNLLMLFSCDIGEDIVDITENTSTVENNEAINSEPEPDPVASDPVVPAPVASGPVILGSGSIITEPDYDFSGDFEIVRENGVQELRFANNFVGGAIRVAVYLSNSRRSTFGGVFLADGIGEGAQSHVIPNDVEVSDFRFVFLYCSAVSLPLGSGEIN